MGLFSGVGKLLNNVTGATSAAKTSQTYALQSAFLNNKFQKEFAQNAHQWEAQDLMKAGYNPALTTGLGGASTGGAGGVSSGTANAGSGTGLLEGIGAIVGMKNQTSATKAQVKLAKAEATLKNAQAIRQLMDNKIFQELGRKEKIVVINKMLSGTELNDAMTDYTKRKASGKGININTPWGGGGFNW